MINLWPTLLTEEETHSESKIYTGNRKTYNSRKHRPEETTLPTAHTVQYPKIDNFKDLLEDPLEEQMKLVEKFYSDGVLDSKIIMEINPGRYYGSKLRAMLYLLRPLHIPTPPEGVNIDVFLPLGTNLISYVHQIQITDDHIYTVFMFHEIGDVPLGYHETTCGLTYNIVKLSGEENTYKVVTKINKFSRVRNLKYEMDTFYLTLMQQLKGPVTLICADTDMIRKLYFSNILYSPYSKDKFYYEGITSNKVEDYKQIIVPRNDKITRSDKKAASQMSMFNRLMGGSK